MPDKNANSAIDTSLALSKTFNHKIYEYDIGLHFSTEPDCIAACQRRVVARVYFAHLSEIRPTAEEIAEIVPLPLDIILRRLQEIEAAEWQRYESHIKCAGFA